MAVAAHDFETASERRKHERDEAQARDLLLHLERQAREILGLAASTEFDTSVQSFAHYQSFRRKVEEFEALCSVIDGQLRKVIGDEQGVLKELFHTRRDMILGPSIKAMTAFFTRLGDAGVLPFGLYDVLERELKAVTTMRETFDGAASADGEARAQLDALEGLIQQLQAKATQYHDFGLPGAVDAALPPMDEPSSVETHGAAANDFQEDEADASPPVRAAQALRAIIGPYHKVYGLSQHAEIDLRAIDDIERRLTANVEDMAAIKWLRHICKAWSSRLHKKAPLFKKIAEMIG